MTAADRSRSVIPPTASEAALNRAFGRLVAAGLAPEPFRLLEVRGRKTGKAYVTPVDLLRHAGAEFLVAPRGRTQWVRNAEASGEVTLRRGRRRARYAVRAVEPTARAPILKAYLDAFARRVQRFFAVPAGSPVEAFAAVAERHPVFALTRLEDEA